VLKPLGIALAAVLASASADARAAQPDSSAVGVPAQTTAAQPTTATTPAARAGARSPTSVPELAGPAGPPAPTPAPPADVGTAAAPSLADAIANPGYVPGYRTYQGLSLGPSVPRVGALPGGVTAGYSAPMPLTQWTFRLGGSLNDSFQSSLGHRMVTGPGQTSTVFHIPPQVIDEYASFLGTSTMPGQWVALNLAYGTPVVSANLSLSTWNPTDPTTYYQIGSQGFIANAFLEFNPSPLGDLKTRALVGYLYNVYGGLGTYGLGMYTNPLIAGVRGVGEDVLGEYRLTPTLTLLVEEGFMGGRNGKVPDGVVPDGGNSGANPIFPAAWIAHLHLGLLRSGPTAIKAQLHWLTNWAQDDRVQCQGTSNLYPCLDNPVSREIDESYVPDGHLNVVGADVNVSSASWGYLGVAASYTSGVAAYPLKGLNTFGGEGQVLTDRWWGSATGGTGALYVAGLNWSASLAKLLSGRLPFRSDGPDVTLNAALVVAYTTAQASAVSGATLPGALPPDTDQFNHRLRYKAAVDGLYTLWSWMAAGLRVDRVAPTSKDSAQTFYVLAPRLVFRTNWGARETIALIYGKWFYGPNTHPDGSSIIAPDGRLDDQLIALNVNLWW
jgi:hypothetical protein